MDIKVSEPVPGVREAQEVQGLLRKAGIHDVQLFYDEQIKMWAVCQVNKPSGRILIPEHYLQDDIKPYILWWCKDERSMFRAPSMRDFQDIITVVKRAPDIWAQGEKRADKFDEQDAARDAAHNKRQSDRIKEVAPRLKRAIRKEGL